MVVLSIFLQTKICVIPQIPNAHSARWQIFSRVSEMSVGQSVHHFCPDWYLNYHCRFAMKICGPQRMYSIDFADPLTIPLVPLTSWCVLLVEKLFDGLPWLLIQISMVYDFGDPLTFRSPIHVPFRMNYNHFNHTFLTFHLTQSCNQIFNLTNTSVHDEIPAKLISAVLCVYCQFENGKQHTCLAAVC